MKNRNLYRIILCSMFTALCLMTTASANSSWIWLTGVQPVLVLPIAILITLAIEILAIKFIGKVSQWGRTVLVVTGANVVSFLVPYIIRFVGSYLPLAGFSFTSLQRTFSGGPYYIVLLGYLLITLIFEIPVVYWGLRKSVNCEKYSQVRLILVIVAANVITTVLVAVTERIFCQGLYV